MVAVIFAVLLGILARTVIPFLLTLRDNPDTKFDRAFLVPAIVAVLIALLTSPLVFAAIPQDQLNNPAPVFSDLVLLFVAAWGTTDVVREGQKLLTGSKPKPTPGTAGGATA